MTEQLPERGSTAPSSSLPDSQAEAAQHRFRWLLGPAIVLIAILLVRNFLVAPFSIPSGSMENTLLVGDRVLVNRLVDTHDLKRGDVVVFDATRAFHLQSPPASPLRRVVDAVAGLVGQGSDTDYVKRIIGVPGDRVRCCADDGRLVVNGDPIDEPWIKPGEVPSRVTFDVTVPADRYWVLGDNRGNSSDARSHLGDPGGGMLPAEDIIGQVWVRYWPLDRLGSIDPTP